MDQDPLLNFNKTISNEGKASTENLYAYNSNNLSKNTHEELNFLQKYKETQMFSAHTFDDLLLYESISNTHPNINKEKINENGINTAPTVMSIRTQPKDCEQKYEVFNHKNAIGQQETDYTDFYNHEIYEENGVISEYESMSSQRKKKQEEEIVEETENTENIRELCDGFIKYLSAKGFKNLIVNITMKSINPNENK